MHTTHTHEYAAATAGLHVCLSNSSAAFGCPHLAILAVQCDDVIKEMEQFLPSNFDCVRILWVLESHVCLRIRSQ